MLELVPPGTKIDFIGHRQICLRGLGDRAADRGVVAIPLRGMRLGIDFAGGTEVAGALHRRRHGRRGEDPRLLGELRSARPDRRALRRGRHEFLLSSRVGRRNAAAPTRAHRLPQSRPRRPRARPPRGADPGRQITAQTDRIIRSSTQLGWSADRVGRRSCASSSWARRSATTCGDDGLEVARHRDCSLILGLHRVPLQLALRARARWSRSSTTCVITAGIFAIFRARVRPLRARRAARR